MIEKARVDAPEALHHIIVRGIEGARFFKGGFISTKPFTALLVLDNNFIFCKIETSGKTVVGSSGVPFRRLAKPEGTHPQGALFINH